MLTRAILIPALFQRPMAVGWNRARRNCKVLHGGGPLADLVTIESAEERDFVASLVRSYYSNDWHSVVLANDKFERTNNNNGYGNVGEGVWTSCHSPSYQDNVQTDANSQINWLDFTPTDAMKKSFGWAATGEACFDNNTSSNDVNPEFVVNDPIVIMDRCVLFNMHRRDFNYPFVMSAQRGSPALAQSWLVDFCADEKEYVCRAPAKETEVKGSHQPGVDWHLYTDTRKTTPDHGSFFAHVAIEKERDGGAPGFTWREAREMCNEIGGRGSDLAVVDTQEKQTFLSNKVISYDHLPAASLGLWIGCAAGGSEEGGQDLIIPQLDRLQTLDEFMHPFRWVGSKNMSCAHNRTGVYSNWGPSSVSNNNSIGRAVQQCTSLHMPAVDKLGFGSSPGDGNASSDNHTHTLVWTYKPCSTRLSFICEAPVVPPDYPIHKHFIAATTTQTTIAAQGPESGGSDGRSTGDGGAGGSGGNGSGAVVGGVVGGILVLVLLVGGLVVKQQHRQQAGHIDNFCDGWTPATRFEARRAREFSRELCRLTSEKANLTFLAKYSRRLFSSVNSAEEHRAVVGQLEIARHRFQFEGVLGKGNYGEVKLAVIAPPPAAGGGDAPPAGSSALETGTNNTVVVNTGGAAGALNSSATGDCGFPRRVAVKSRFAHEDDPAVDEALLIEALVLHALEHPAVLGLVGISTHAMPFLVATELMVNGDLKTYLRACRPSQPHPKAKLTLLDIAIMVEKIAAALAYLESVQVVHRDVAARNVLVGQTHTEVKLGDLGAARSVFREKAREYTATTDHKPARWMSLEALKTATFSHKTDVWAFAVFCWEVTTLAKTPYGALGVRDMVMSLTNGDRLEEALFTPPGLYKQMLLCWSEDPKRRPRFANLVQSIGSIRGALAVTEDGKTTLGYDKNTLLTSTGMVRGLSIIRNSGNASAGRSSSGGVAAGVGAGDHAGNRMNGGNGDYSTFSDAPTAMKATPIVENSDYSTFSDAPAAMKATPVVENSDYSTFSDHGAASSSNGAAGAMGGGQMGPKQPELARDGYVLPKQQQPQPKPTRLKQLEGTSDGYEYVEVPANAAGAASNVVAGCDGSGSTADRVKYRPVSEIRKPLPTENVCYNVLEDTDVKLHPPLRRGNEATIRCSDLSVHYPAALCFC